MSSLVRFYYSWKKSRSKTSLMDRQSRKARRDREDRWVWDNRQTGTSSVLTLMLEYSGYSSDDETEEPTLNPPGVAQLDPLKEEKKEVRSCRTIRSYLYLLVSLDHQRVVLLD